MAKRASNFTLGAGSRVRYAPLERALFALLKDEPQTTIALAMRHYRKNAPFNARLVIGGRLRSLQRKMKENREPVRVALSKRRGPHPIEAWLER